MKDINTIVEEVVEQETKNLIHVYLQASDDDAALTRFYNGTESLRRKAAKLTRLKFAEKP